MAARFIVILRARGISEFLFEFGLAPGRLTARVVNAQPAKRVLFAEGESPGERASDRERLIAAALARDRRGAGGQKSADARVELRLEVFRTVAQFHGR